MFFKHGAGRKGEGKRGGIMRQPGGALLYAVMHILTRRNISSETYRMALVLRPESTHPTLILARTPYTDWHRAN